MRKHNNILRDAEDQLAFGHHLTDVNSSQE